MKPEGWIFLFISLSCVWGLAIWCYWKLLFEKKD